MCIKRSIVELNTVFAQSVIKAYYKNDMIKMCGTGTRKARMTEQNRMKKLS